jgi:hypothetical protein
MAFKILRKKIIFSKPSILGDQEHSYEKSIQTNDDLKLLKKLLIRKFQAKRDVNYEDIS